MEIVVLKIRIHRELRQRRHGTRLENVYPDFNSLPAEVRTPPGARGPLDWAIYVDQVGWGWLYDNVSGFGFSDDENPDRDLIYGCVGVLEDFAQAAVAAFPDVCSIMDPDEFVRWRSERAMAGAERVRYNTDRLTGLRAAIELAKELNDQATLAELKVEARKALDPADPAQGINANERLDWDNFARGRGIRLKGRP